METPDQQRARDARHEAAHVVAAVRFSHRFQIVTIEPKDQKRGYVSYPDDWDENPTPERAREIAIIDIAAYVDEELYGLVVDDGAFFDKVHAEPAKAFWGGARWHFAAALVAALLLSTISIAAQVLYLELDALKGAAHIPPGALDGVPVIGWLVGNNGGGWVVLGRAIGFHVAEAACCFVLAKSTEHPEKRMLAMQREQRAMQELQRFERISALERLRKTLRDDQQQLLCPLP